MCVFMLMCVRYLSIYAHICVHILSTPSPRGEPAVRLLCLPSPAPGLVPAQPDVAPARYPRARPLSPLTSGRGGRRACGCRRAGLWQAARNPQSGGGGSKTPVMAPGIAGGTPPAPSSRPFLLPRPPQLPAPPLDPLSSLLIPAPPPPPPSS